MLVEKLNNLFCYGCQDPIALTRLASELSVRMEGCLLISQAAPTSCSNTEVDHDPYGVLVFDLFTFQQVIYNSSLAFALLTLTKSERGVSQKRNCEAKLAASHVE